MEREDEAAHITSLEAHPLAAAPSGHILRHFLQRRQIRASDEDQGEQSCGRDDVPAAESTAGTSPACLAACRRHGEAAAGAPQQTDTAVGLVHGLWTQRYVRAIFPDHAELR